MRTPGELVLLLAATLVSSCAAVAGATAQSAPPNGVDSPQPGELAAEADEDFRRVRPLAAARKDDFEAPIPVEVELPNGARLLLVENHSVPLVAIEVLIRTGVNAEPDDKGGLAGFTASMLTEGTARRSALAFSAAMEDLAVRWAVDADLETTRLRLNCLTEALPQALDLLAEALTSPAFRPEELERVRGILLTGLLQRRSSPQALAADQAARVLYGEAHPWGRPAGGIPQSLKAIGRGDLVRFHRTWYRPNNAIVSISGDTSRAEAIRLLCEKLARWRPAPLPELHLPQLPSLEQRSVTVVELPAATQSQIWMVGRLFSANSPDRVPFAVANNVFGGLFTSRLNSNLRERRGYSYGVFSNPRLGRSYGALYVSGGVQAQFTAESLDEILKELQTFRSGELRDGELAGGTQAILRGLPAALETNDAVASSMAWLAHLGMPLDWYRRLPELVSRVDALEVGRVAAEYFRPDRMAVIVVGPESRKRLEALGLGPVEVRTAESPSDSPGHGR